MIVCLKNTDGVMFEKHHPIYFKFFKIFFALE
jgi:hypothetical protein